MYLDINSEPIQSHQYNVESDVMNIEIGGGLSKFSKTLFPQSYLTDLKIPNSIPHFSVVENTETICHFIDFECDIFKYAFGGKLFEKIIICNPYGYGFKHDLDGVYLLNKLGSILRPEGYIYILSSTKNPYTAKISKLLENRLPNKINFNFDVQHKAINSEELYSDITFTKCDLTTVTKPNVEIILKIIA